MTTERRERLDALLGAVYARPSDDAPRLVLADWLQEHQEPWGELIALQCRRQSDGVAAAPARERRLIDKHGADWLGPLADVIEPRGVRFERGFVAGCSLRDVAVPESLRSAPAWSTVSEVWGWVPPPLRAHLAQLGVRFSDEPSPLRASWTWLAAWLERCAPELLPMRAGASEAAIAAAERTLGRALTTDHRELLAIVDGTPIDGGTIGGWSLLSATGLAEEWSFMRQLEQQIGNEFPEHVDGPVRDLSWNPAYVPLARRDGRSRLLVDLDPAPGGLAGQVITFAYETHTRRVVAPSVRAWIAGAALAWQEGSVVAVEDGEGELDAVMERADWEAVDAAAILDRDLAVRPRRRPRAAEVETRPARLAADEEGARLLEQLLAGGLVRLTATASDEDRAALSKGLGQRLRARTASDRKATEIIDWLDRQPSIDELFFTDAELAALLELW